jgi:ABC-2 type transport system permease protein
MLERLKVEWIKLRSYRTFWILGILYLVSIVGANYLGYWIQEETYREEQVKGMLQMMEPMRPYEFPKVYHTTAWVSYWLLFMPSLLMIIIMSNEYTYKTHRQNIIDGWSRHQFITTKLVLVVIAAFISAVMVGLTATFFGFINREPFSASQMIYIFYFFIQALSYIAAAFLISLLIKRAGLAIGLFFMYALILENVLAFLLNKYMNYSGRYLPLESTDNLIPFPVFERAQRVLASPYNTTALFITTLIYLGAYFYITHRKFKTTDL